MSFDCTDDQSSTGEGGIAGNFDPLLGHVIYGCLLLRRASRCCRGILVLFIYFQCDSSLEELACALQ